jgi:DNA-binding beta-propeller fold protein YncE
MIASNRRQFIAGALSTALVPAGAKAQTQTPTAPGRLKRRVRHRSRAIAVAPRGKRLVIAHERERTIAIVTGKRRRSVDVGGQPVEVAVSPDGRLAAVSTGSWDLPGLAVVDLASGKRRRRLDVGPAPFGVAFSSDGGHLVATGGEQEGTVSVLRAPNLRPVAETQIGIGPRGVAVVPGAEEAWIALQGSDQLIRIGLADASILRTIRTPPLPERVAVSPDGKRLLVSHGGRDSERISEIDVRSGRAKRLSAGRMPSAVAWGPGGSRLVALAGSGEILAISPGGRRRRYQVGGVPRGLAVVGRRAWTVDGLTGLAKAVNL